MSNIYKLPTSIGQAHKADEEQAEASFAQRRLETICRIEAGIELRKRAFNEGLNHLPRRQVIDFLDALKDGRIDDATEIFDGDSGLAVASTGYELGTVPSLAHVAPFDASPRPVYSVSTEATPVVALTGEHTLTSSQNAGLTVERGKFDLATGHAARLNSGYASLTLLLYQGALKVEDAEGAPLASAIAPPLTCVAVQIEAGACGLGGLTFKQDGGEPVVGLWVAARYSEEATTSALSGPHRVRVSQPISIDPAVPAERVREALSLNVPSNGYSHIAAVHAGDFSRYHLCFDSPDEDFDCKLFLLTNGVRSIAPCLDQGTHDFYTLRDHDGLEVIAMLRGGLWAQFTDYRERRDEDGPKTWQVSRDPAKFEVPSDRRHESQFATASISNGRSRSDVVAFDSSTGHHVAMVEGVPSFGLHMSFPLELHGRKQLRTRDVVTLSQSTKKHA